MQIRALIRDRPRKLPAQRLPAQQTLVLSLKLSLNCCKLRDLR